MIHSLSIRDGQVADARAVQAIAGPIMESFGLVPDFDVLDYELGHFGQGYQGAIAQLVACVDDLVIGSAILKEYGDELAKLTGFYVCGGYRGMGAGQRLLTEVIRRANDRGCRAIYLETWDKMEAATALYKRLGWQKVKDLHPDSGAERGYLLELQPS
ncbi:GNAT family N-acetyltransferase [Ferrimonas futtsuensis]|uniref:GNAT family N-acetyltransferase n=1 Tax=Ferrimonas futtsuensis TaxID=364764 RepID=UPI0003FAD5BD|nr:GNAT family N-acetyltransferase [Ferrimonas futtsuensis]